MQAIIALCPVMLGWALGLDLSLVGRGQSLDGVRIDDSNGIQYLVNSDLTFEVVVNTEDQPIKALEFLTNTFEGLVNRELSPVIVRIFHIFPKQNKDEWIRRALYHDWTLLDDVNSTGFKRLRFRSGRVLDMTPLLTLGNFFLIRGFFPLHSIVIHLEDDTGVDDVPVPPQEPVPAHSEPDAATPGRAFNFTMLLWVLLAVVLLSTAALIYCIRRLRNSKTVQLLHDVEYKMVELQNSSRNLSFVLIGGYRQTPDSKFDRFLLGAYDCEQNCLVPVCVLGPELPSEDIQELNDTINEAGNFITNSFENFQKPDVVVSSNRVWTFNSDEVIAEAENQLPIRLVSPRLIRHDVSSDFSQDLSQVRLVLDRARARYHVD